MATLEKLLITESMEIVSYSIKVEGKEIDKKFPVLSIMVETGVNKIPSATIVINVDELSTELSEKADTSVFLPGNKIEIQLGYKKNDVAENQSVFLGRIIRNSQKINNNCSELTVDCKHFADVLTYTRVSKEMAADSLDSDMIDFVLGLHKDKIENGYIVNTSRTKHSQVVQVNTTDWDFIMSRLDIAGMICIFPDSKLTVQDIPTEKSEVDAKSQGGSPGDTPPVDFRLTYGRNILEFDGEMDPRVEASMVRLETWNYKDQKIETAESADEVCEAKPSNQNNDQDSKAADKLDYTWTISTPANIEGIVGASIARTKKLRQCLSKIKGSVKYLGTTKLVPGSFAQLIDVGPRFDGKAFVTNIQHEYADGCWITTAVLGWDEKFFTEQTNPGHANSPTGQASSIQGLHVGKVTSIEDKDGQYRVKVKLPMVDNESEGIYARVATLDAGKDRGTFFRPEADDEVVIGFLSDDPANPVILGCLHSSTLKSPMEPDKNNHKKGYISRSAIKLLFDDDRKSVTVETPGKRVVELDDKEGIISLKDDFGNKIVMDKSGITIESAGDIIMKAKKEISANAQTQLELKGSRGAKLEGSGPVTVQSSANTIIKGSMVMIN